MILVQNGIDNTIAIYDSVLSNILLGGMMLLMATMLRYYIPQKNKQGYILTLSVMLTLIWLFGSRFLLVRLLDGGDVYNNALAQSLLIRGASGFLILTAMALIAVLWFTVQDQQETDKRKMEADKLARQAELNNLRQQLQPHFLFNSLNSINALIRSQPESARTMIQQLSDFLRGTLKKEESQWVDLEEELHQLDLYLQIEKVRFGHRLSATIMNEADGTKLPAMLLQPVVENAIKFGLYDTTGEVNIIISAVRNDQYLVVEVSNPFDPSSTAQRKGAGFGLSSVQRRLYLLFARQDLVKTEVKDDLFITTIKIPQP